MGNRGRGRGPTWRPDHHGHQKVTQLHVAERRITAVSAVDLQTGEVTRYEADYFFSTMPVQELIGALDADVPANVREVSGGLIYRDFITVGLLVNKLVVDRTLSQRHKPISDNWIYIQEPDVQLGRLQIFNNWSPYMVADPSKTWMGLEYFCYESDALWKMSDPEIVGAGERRIVADRHYRSGRCRGLDRDSHAQDLSRLLRHLRSVR